MLRIIQNQRMIAAVIIPVFIVESGFVECTKFIDGLPRAVFRRIYLCAEQIIFTYHIVYRAQYAVGQKVFLLNHSYQTACRAKGSEALRHFVHQHKGSHAAI